LTILQDCRIALGLPPGDPGDHDDADVSDAAFVVLVDLMRVAQKMYFRDRSSIALSVSKKLERRVDDAIAARSRTEKQGSMF
jgi:hypothetical protein